MVDCRDSHRIDLDLHILHVGCGTGTHIDDLHTFDYSVHFEHCFVDHCSARLRFSGRLPGSFVDFLSLGGSQLWHDFLHHR